MNSLRIYDRWGNLVHYTENVNSGDPSIRWLGRIDGKEAELGVYVYYLVYTIDGLQENLVGSITLLR